MLRWVFCILLVAVIAPTLAASEERGTQIADPPNRERAARLLSAAPDDLKALTYRLFDAQFKCQGKAAFDRAKAELLKKLERFRSLLPNAPQRKLLLLVEGLEYRNCPKPNRPQMVDLAGQRHAMSAFRELFGARPMRIADTYV